ncbi:cell division protein ZapA [Paenibacillus sp. P26]|nr:cell division protein ZapA [Paenibacillus sp. P26]
MNGEDKIRMTVNIYGTQYKLVSNSSHSHIKNVVALVNDQMHRIAESNSWLDLPKIAVLSAVNMADEWTRMQEELQRSLERQKQLEKAREELEVLHELHKELEQELTSERERLKVLEAQRSSLEAAKAQAEAEAAKQTERVNELAERSETLTTELAEARERLTGLLELSGEQEERARPGAGTHRRA